MTKEKKVAKKVTKKISLFAAILSKSKKAIDKAKRPLLEKKAKREFKSMVGGMLEEIIDIKEATIELFTNAKALDLPEIMSNRKTIKELVEEINEIGEVYKTLFWEDLDIDREDVNLEFDVNEILGKADDEDEDEEDED